jgi:hypothetical protein
MRLALNWLALVLLLSFFGIRLVAQDQGCREVTVLKQIVHANSMGKLAHIENENRLDYRANVALAARRFELVPKSRSAASALLDLIPANVDEHVVWITFGDSMCETETIPEMEMFDRFGSRLEHKLTAAVLLLPEKMPEYIGFASEALTNPHSDYAEEMQKVCKSDHLRLLQAINAMPTEDRDWFAHHILDPSSCKALKLAEAE